MTELSAVGYRMQLQDFLTITREENTLAPFNYPSTGLQLLLEYNLRFYCSVIKPEMDLTHFATMAPKRWNDPTFKLLCSLFVLL